MRRTKPTRPARRSKARRCCCWSTRAKPTSTSACPPASGARSSTPTTGPTLPASITRCRRFRSCCYALRLDRVRLVVPRHGGAAEVRLVRQVTGERRVATEHHVLNDRLPRPYGLEIIPEVRPRVVEVGRRERDALGQLRSLPRRQIVILAPLLVVRGPHRARIAAGVVARILILAALR